MNRLLLCLLPLLLTACVGMVQVGPGDVTIREKLVANLDSAWNRFDAPGGGARTEVWTTDGLTLDTLRFFVGVPDGEPLFEVRNAKDKQVPRFRASMQPQEIVEMFDALISQGGDRFRLDKLSPAAFAGGDGFRFDYGLTRKGDEVELKGFAYGIVRDKQLTLMIFHAPKLHYYAKHVARAEAVARSVRVKG